MSRSILNQIVNGDLAQKTSRFVEVALIDNYSLTRDCIITATCALDDEISFVPFNSIRDCITCRAPNFGIILYYPHEKATGDRLVGQEITTLRQAFTECPILILSDAAQALQPSVVREVLRSGASGIISTRTIEMAAVSAAIRYAMSGGIVVPVDIILASSGPLSDSCHNTSDQIDLTSRQITVLGHLRQGKANKIIAHELHMSESTVKVHVRNILRKMGATNRTQAVYNALQLRENVAEDTRAVERTGGAILEMRP